MIAKLALTEQVRYSMLTALQQKNEVRRGLRGQHRSWFIGLAQEKPQNTQTKNNNNNNKDVNSGLFPSDGATALNWILSQSFASAPAQTALT